MSHAELAEIDRVVVSRELGNELLRVSVGRMVTDADQHAIPRHPGQLAGEEQTGTKGLNRSVVALGESRTVDELPQLVNSARPDELATCGTAITEEGERRLARVVSVEAEGHPQMLVTSYQASQKLHRTRLHRIDEGLHRCRSVRKNRHVDPVLNPERA
jgi:hypothetical protein